MWRWLRFLIALVAAVLVFVVAGTAWLLSGQRYQILLTEQLSQLLGAKVHVSGSRFSLAGGLGIELAGVTIQRPNEGAPFLTSERINVLLGLKALLRGHLLFHQMNAVRPQIRIVEDSDGGLARIAGLLSATGTTIATQPEATGWFVPTLAVRHVGISDGSVTYIRKTQQDVPFVFTQLHLLISHPAGAGVAMQGQVSLGAKAELGTVALQATALTWSAQVDQRQVAWQGSIQLHDVMSHQLGRALGYEWPRATLSANLRYDGKRSGPVRADGTVNARNVQVGAIHLRMVAGTIAQLQWAGRGKQTSVVSWSEFLKDVTTEIHIEHLQGATSEEPAQFSLSKGTLTLRDGTLAVRGLSGDYGKKSHLRGGEVIMPQVALGLNRECAAALEVDMNLQEDLRDLLAVLAKLGVTDVGPQVQHPRGSATVMVSLYSHRCPAALSFDGEVVLQQVAFRLPSIKPEVSDLTGKIRVTNKFIETIAATPLALKLGDSWVQATGRVLDYTSQQRKVDLHINSDLAFAELPDLERGLTRVRGVISIMEGGTLSQFVMNPQGRVQVQMDVHTAVPSGVLSYEGTVTFQQGEMTLPKWNLALNKLEGTVRVDKQTLATDGLTFGIEGVPIQLKGVLRDYLVPQRNGEGQVSFTGLRDATLASLLSQKLVVMRDGTLDGKIDVSVPREGEIRTGGKLTLNNMLLDPLPNVFHPLGIVQGQLAWQGQNVDLTITQGSSAGGMFTGKGRISSLSPLNLELAVDFADLDLGAAFNLDKPKVDDQRPKNDTVQVRVNLHAGHLQYKTFAAEHVQALCYWHGRQADLQVTEAKTAGGTLNGDATLWPDSKELHLTPHVTGVDVSQLLSMLNTPSDRITGILNGEGKIYFPDWHDWANLAHWRAHLSLAIADGVAQQIPILVRLWSAVSLQELLSFQLPSLLNDGLAFSSLVGDFSLGGGVAITPHLSFASNSVRIEATGEIDLVQHTLDLKTSFMPLHGITSSVAKVPLAGELIARGAEMLTTLPFRVYGPYHDPTVTPLVIDLGQW